VGIYFGRNHQCYYAYKLEGFDQKWNRVGSKRAATYTNLNPGHYTFRVKAANPEGGWNEAAKSIQVHILPPWYLQWWAYFIYFTLLIAAFIQYRKYITNRERLKAELRLKELEANNARQLEQLKTDFFNDVSHELRTPLTLILDPAERLSAENNFSSTQIKNFASIIQSNAQRLFRLVNQLLDLAKITADKYQLHIEFHDLIALFNDTINAFKYQFTKQGIELIFNTQVETLYAWFDADALEKMLYNLLSNAIKAKSTLIEIAISVDYDASNQPQIATIKVCDNGVGIPQNQIPRLFERFYQIENEAVDASLGTGVGLSLVAELVRIHRGQIQVDSKSGEGTTFTLYLPIQAQAFPSEWLASQLVHQMAQKVEHQAPVDPLSMEQETSNTIKNRKLVLIAEDNTEMQAYLQGNFASQFNVISCSNGQEAYHQAVQHIPDIVISDLVMPIMDGIALCSALKQNELTSHIPVILLTSRSMVESQLKGLQAGADDYVTKPFHLNLLLARVINLIKQREALSTRIAQSPLQALTHKELMISETDENFLKKVIEVIDANIANTEFGVEQLEEALLMGRMQLYRKLTSLTSMSGNAFIRHIRLQRASELLEKSNLSVAEIAYRVGFNSPSYFTQIYKKAFGKLPSGLNSK
jgi:signal transduction histidine kinase/DNA-binding response OmpR family regulator